MSHVTCHVTHVMCHMSCATCHVSDVMCHIHDMCHMSSFVTIITLNISPITLLCFGVLRKIFFM